MIFPFIIGVGAVLLALALCALLERYIPNVGTGLFPVPNTKTPAGETTATSPWSGRFLSEPTSRVGKPSSTAPRPSVDHR